MGIMTKVYVAAVARTPIGGFGGQLASLTAPQLGSIAIKAAVERSKVALSEINEVYYGNVLSAGIGQNPARQAARAAGIPDNVPCTTINKVCASGMKAVALGTQSIMLGISDVVVAGGMESMSNTPYYLNKLRWGSKYGNTDMTDGIVKDGLTDAYHNVLMGNCAEMCAREYEITRTQQDDYAVMSYKRSQEATKNGWFDEEIVPVQVSLGRGKGTSVVKVDEEVKNLNEEKLRTVKPVFEENGTITAPNASTLSDGASALVLMSEEKVTQLGIKPLARILSFADAEQAPEKFPTTPALALPLALARANLSPADIDYYEVNEAFSVVALANAKLLSLPMDKVNAFGGAVSMGHPLGSSGSRILCTLISVLKQKGGKRGAAGICNGGGGATAMILELC